MKSGMKLFVISVTLISPVVSFSQTPAPTSRAEVREELIQLEKSGYQPFARDEYYPAKIEAADAKVAQQGSVSHASATDVGGTNDGATQHGSPSASRAAKSIYFGH